MHHNINKIINNNLLWAKRRWREENGGSKISGNIAPETVPPNIRMIVRNEEPSKEYIIPVNEGKFIVRSTFKSTNPMIPNKSPNRMCVFLRILPH